MRGPVRTAPTVPVSRSMKTAHLFEKSLPTSSTKSNSKFFVDPWEAPKKTKAIPAVKGNDQPPPRPPQPKNSLLISSLKIARSDKGSCLSDLSSDWSRSKTVHTSSGSGSLFGSTPSLVWEQHQQSQPAPTSSQSARASPTGAISASARGTGGCSGNWPVVGRTGSAKGREKLTGSGLNQASSSQQTRPTIIRPAKLPSSSSQNSLSGFAERTSVADSVSVCSGASWGSGNDSATISDGLSLLAKTVDRGYNSWNSDYPSSSPPTSAPPLPPLDVLLGAKRQPSYSPVPSAEALYDYTSQEDGDLSFVTGQRILLLEQVNPEWLRGRLDSPSSASNDEGIFPAAYVQVLVPLPDCNPVSNTAIAQQYDTNLNNGHLEHQLDTGVDNGPVHEHLVEQLSCTSLDSGNSSKHQSSTGKSDGVRAMTLYDFQTDVEEDLTFSSGEFVIVLGKLNDDWGYGTRRGCSGQFPLSYVDVDPGHLAYL